MAASADIGKDFQQQQSMPRAMVQAVTDARSMVVLSGLTVATPLLVIFSPVPVPAAVAAFLIAAGFLASGGFGSGGAVTAVVDVRADQLVPRARDAKDSPQHRIEQAAQ